MHKLIYLLAAIILTQGCEQQPEQPPQPAAPEAASTVSEASRLEQILKAQPEAAQARYVHRHPQETLEFFGITPGATVVEALPGGGWYSKILLPLLGSEGRLVGVNYPQDLWPNFSFVDDAYLQRMSTWTTDWPASAEEWRDADSAPVSAFKFGSMPETLNGQADAVLFVRALHNLARFNDPRPFLAEALSDTFNVLKPGGIVGIVQHEARPDMPDEWATGQNGYLKRDFIIDQMQQAGFEFVAASDINANPKDQPTAEDYVWRLPPSYDSAGDDEARRAAMDEIGESNRMTLKFIKPKA